MSAPRHALRCAARHLGHATHGVWCDRCALDAEQLLGVVRGVLAPMRDGSEVAALLDGVACAVQSVGGLILTERTLADHAQDFALDIARDAWTRGMALVSAEAAREYDAARAVTDGTVAEVRRERVLALEGLATRARRLWHLMAPQGGPEGA
jgi:hypothetical protein